MSEEQAVEYIVEERDLNLEPEKFHVIKQVFRVLIGIPASLIIKIKERIKTRKQRKLIKKEERKARWTRRLNWGKAFAQRVKSRFSKFATCSKEFKHQWAMAGMTEEEKEQYKIDHGLVEPEQKTEKPAPQPTPVQSQPEEPKPASTTPENPDSVPVEEQSSYISYLESSKTISVINEQIRTELAKGSEADFELIGQYRAQLKTEEMQRDNCLEAHILKCKGEPKKGVETVQAPAEETAPEGPEKHTTRLLFGSAAQRVARRKALIARGPKGIVTTMKCSVAQAKKEAAIRVRDIVQRAQELGKQILVPVDSYGEVAVEGGFSR